MGLTINDLPDEIFDQILNELPALADYFIQLRLVSSKWNQSVLRYFAKIKHLKKLIWSTNQGLETMNRNKLPFILITKDDLISRCILYKDKLLSGVVSDMHLLPNLKGVGIDRNGEFFGKDQQNLLVRNLNARPEITALELTFSEHRRPENDVKPKYIRSFAFHGGANLKEALTFFEPDHEFTQIYTPISEPVIDHVRLLFKKMPNLRRLTQYGQGFKTIQKLSSFDAQKNLIFKNLEFYSFHSYWADPLEYLDSFVDCCPNLKNVDLRFLALLGSDSYRLNNLKTHSHIENLIIESRYGCLWEYVLQIIGMFPNIKTLKLVGMNKVGHNELSSALRKLPNLSLLFLRHFKENSKEAFGKVQGSYMDYKEKRPIGCSCDVQHIDFEEITKVIERECKISYSYDVSYLRRFDDYIEKSSKQAKYLGNRLLTNNMKKKTIIPIDCDALQEEFKKLHKRELKIIRRDEGEPGEGVSFKHGFDFFKNFFWSDSIPYLLTE